MKLDSVRGIKFNLSEAIRSADETPEAHAFFASTLPPMPPGVALGVTKKGDEHLLAVRVQREEDAAPYVEMAKGEADVRVVAVSKRLSPGYLQAARRPLEPGLQIGMFGKDFVGTLGGFVRDEARAFFALSNSHVIADEGRVSAGWKIGQPFGRPDTMVGVLERFVPFSETSPNLVDAAIMRVDRTQKALPRFNGAIGRDLQAVRMVGPDDLGLRVFKAGRSTGSREGNITAVEVDGLPVAYDRGVLRFNDQIEVSGGLATDFSAAGDSGSWIVTDDGYVLGLLFAGGRDSKGEDFTYGNYMVNVLAALGVSLP